MRYKPSFILIKEKISLGLARFRHPFSLPAEIGGDLGWEITNQENFPTLIQKVLAYKTPPNNLKKNMTRKEALAAFSHAFRTETFHQKVICSYYFKQGWLEFELVFDPQDRLRRVSLQAPTIPHDFGVEIPLQSVI